MASIIPAQTAQDTATEQAKKLYKVGQNYTVDNSAYAAGTTPQAIALQSYDRQLDAFKSALQANYDSQAAANTEQARKLAGQYDANRSNAYTNARLSAIGNNERLAAKGLAGNLYDYARSGTSETSRIAQDVGLRKSISGLDQSQTEGNRDLALALLQAQKSADQGFAEYVAKTEELKNPYLQQVLAAAATPSYSGGGGDGYVSSSKSSSGGGGGQDYATALLKANNGDASKAWFNEGLNDPASAKAAGYKNVDSAASTLLAKAAKTSKVVANNLNKYGTSGR